MQIILTILESTPRGNDRGVSPECASDGLGHRRCQDPLCACICHVLHPRTAICPDCESTGLIQTTILVAAHVYGVERRLPATARCPRCDGRGNVPVEA